MRTRRSTRRRLPPGPDHPGFFPGSAGLSSYFPRARYFTGGIMLTWHTLRTRSGPRKQAGKLTKLTPGIGARTSRESNMQNPQQKPRPFRLLQRQNRSALLEQSRSFSKPTQQATASSRPPAFPQTSHERRTTTGAGTTRPSVRPSTPSTLRTRTMSRTASSSTSPRATSRPSPFISRTDPRATKRPRCSSTTSATRRSRTSSTKTRTG